MLFLSQNEGNDNPLAVYYGSIAKYAEMKRKRDRRIIGIIEEH